MNTQSIIFDKYSFIFETSTTMWFFFLLKNLKTILKQIQDVANMIQMKAIYGNEHFINKIVSGLLNSKVSKKLN